MAFEKLGTICVVGLLLGCGGGGNVQTAPMEPGADDSGAASGGLTGEVSFGARLSTTAAVNLRAGPSANEAIRLVMAAGSEATAVRSAPTNGWYEVNYQGRVGWAKGIFLVVKAIPKDARDQALARGQTVWGFSYHWGGDAWDPTSQSPGTCTGSCPTCTHSGSWGSDCSGFVAKAWEVPPTNNRLTVPLHPYGTNDFRYGTAYWSPLNRAQATRADALVYSASAGGGAGHIFLLVGGDPWNAMQALECKGCAEGCVYNNRTASSAYVAIRRQGY